MKEIGTLTIDKSILTNFKNHCDSNGLKMGKTLELILLEYLKMKKQKNEKKRNNG